MSQLQPLAAKKGAEPEAKVSKNIELKSKFASILSDNKINPSPQETQ